MAENENPYTPPRAGVADTQEEVEDKPSVGARFLWGAGTCFVVFMGLIFLVMPSAWAMGAIGSAVFALLSGLISMCIPVKSKLAFILPGLVVSFVIAYFIGHNSREEAMRQRPTLERE